MPPNTVEQTNQALLARAKSRALQQSARPATAPRTTPPASRAPATESGRALELRRSKSKDAKRQLPSILPRPGKAGASPKDQAVRAGKALVKRYLIGAAIGLFLFLLPYIAIFFLAILIIAIIGSALEWFI